jgi:signal transduction histidine kinase
LENLVANGIKFRVADRPPRVSVRTEEGPGGGTILAIEDNGIGFDPKFAREIFLPLRRLHPSSAYEGSGLGLAIAERIAHRYGADISAESEPGRGSTFRVHLPPSALSSH